MHLRPLGPLLDGKHAKIPRTVFGRYEVLVGSLTRFYSVRPFFRASFDELLSSVSNYNESVILDESSAGVPVQWLFQDQNVHEDYTDRRKLIYKHLLELTTLSVDVFSISIYYDTFCPNCVEKKNYITL